MKPVVKKSLIAVAAVVATPILILILMAVLLMCRQCRTGQ